MQDRKGSSQSTHVILTDEMPINALDVLEVLVKGDELDSQVLRDLRDS